MSFTRVHSATGEFIVAHIRGIHHQQVASAKKDSANSSSKSCPAMDIDSICAVDFGEDFHGLDFIVKKTGTQRCCVPVVFMQEFITASKTPAEFHERLSFHILRNWERLKQSNRTQVCAARPKRSQVLPSLFYPSPVSSLHQGWP